MSPQAPPAAPFALLEVMAFLPGEGYRNLEGHLARLARSARVLLHADGHVEVQVGALPPPPRRPLRVGIAARPVDPRSVLAGVERACAIAEGRAREAVVRLADLRPGQRLRLASSLQGVREARLVG